MSNCALGVLQRHESLAANLGAKLVAPLLFKSFEKLFEGPIEVTTPFGAEPARVTWLDIVEFARTKPQEFVLSDSRNGGRTCHFWLKQCSVEISEDDYRLVLSGAPERMIPRQPIVEDEMAELATMDILEQRLSLLIKRVDLIAARARQLNYHLKGRKAAISSHQLPVPNSDQGQSGAPTNFLSPSNPALSGIMDSRTIHQDLLRQFTSDTRKQAAPRAKSGHVHTEALSSPKPGGSPPDNGQVRRIPASLTPNPDDGTGGQYRPLIAARVEKMNRGDQIWPPCDRCRRLRMDCTKYLTACNGCTKKHAKCTWRDITDDEIAPLIQMPHLPSAPVEATPDTLDMEANLDPGLRSSTDFANQMRSNGEGFGNPADNKRTEVFPDEHAILTHMASAAAAQGNRQ